MNFFYFIERKWVLRSIEYDKFIEYISIIPMLICKMYLQNKFIKYVLILIKILLLCTFKTTIEKNNILLIFSIKSWY